MAESAFTLSDVLAAPWDSPIIGARHPLGADGAPDFARAVIHLADGRVYAVERAFERQAPGHFHFARTPIEHSRGSEWDLGYDSGFADGANDESANGANVREAAESALHWLEEERERPGETTPDEIVRVLRAALGQESDHA